MVSLIVKCKLNISLEITVNIVWNNIMFQFQYSFKLTINVGVELDSDWLFFFYADWGKSIVWR